MFGDMPTIDDIVDCWTSSYRIYRVDDMLEWVEWYAIQATEEGGMAFVYKGRYPLAYEEDGTLTTRYAYEWIDVYSSNGTWNKNPRGDPYGGYSYPIITQYNEKVYYGLYDGDNSVVEAFDGVIEFFERLIESVKIYFNMRFKFYRNL